MKLHIIVDFMHIYYKYFFQVKGGKLGRLSAPIEWNGTVIEKDTTLIYHPLHDIEGIRKLLEASGHDVTMSICFDMKSVRTESETEGASEYKSGRHNGLDEKDFQNIEYIEKLLKDAGHNTYRISGYEADDIINYLVKTNKDKFDYTVIYTNDKDIFVNIDDKVGVMRFKQTKGYTQVDKNNYEKYIEDEFGVFIPYNAIGLFLSTAGDTADKIKGISKFGKVAFKKLISSINEKHKVDWSACGDYKELRKVVDICKEFLTDEQFKQMLDSFELVSNVEVINDLPEPTEHSTEEKRKKAYEPLKMISLIP